ncbi:MAG: type VI secretion system tip protein TssI/VgrG [Polyangiaceae bacterium]
MAIAITLPDVSLECRSLRGTEQLGVASRFEITAGTTSTLDAKALLRAPCGITLETRYGERTLAGVVLRVTAVATARTTSERTYRFTVASRLALLEFRRRSRVFQNKSIVDIVRSVLEEGGYRPGDIHVETADSHAPRRYIVQYDETDATFVRRLCEDEGLFFRFDAEDGREILTIADRSSSAPSVLESALALVGDAGLVAPGPTAFDWTSTRRRRPGKVRLRDHDHEKPKVTLDATATAGTPMEQQASVYAAPGGFKDSGGGDSRARLHLESLRASAETATFTTTALALSPGRSFSIEADASIFAPPNDADHVVTAVHHDWTASSDRHVVTVESVPRRVPYRLPRITPRPQIAGLQSAVVTGASGEEVHPDELNRVFVHFHWDTEQPLDEKSSLPVRVLQPSVAGSMLIPRVGWEVQVAFEDGDPERPYVVSRSYNAKMPPPFALPQNKMVTSVATDSSPGGAGRNSVHFDDGAGRQHLKFQAVFGKTTTVGADMITQTAVNERHGVTGSQSRSVGGGESIKVGEALFLTLGSDTMNIAAVDQTDVGGSQNVGVGSETVVVAAAEVEQVGDPMKGVENVAVSAVLQGIGSTGPKGAIASALIGIAKGAAEAGAKDGWAAAGKAAGMGAVGVVAGLVPGGEALLSAITGATQPNPWDHAKDGDGDRAGGGGAGGGASDAAGASGPGPGHRNILATGGLEVNGGFTVLTPGRTTWTTAGASVMITGGSKTVQSSTATLKTLGVSADQLAASSITAATKITRKCGTAANMTVAGVLSEAAGVDYILKAPNVMIAASQLTLNGSQVVFEVPGARVCVTPSGIWINAPQVTFVGAFTQSGDMVVM